MRRTTVFAEEKVLDALRAIARRRGITLAEVTREALSAYVSKRRDRGKTLSIIGIGGSGRRDIAERAEELLKEGFGR
jgi:ribbon-helix-helix CopG family protein